MTGSLHGGLEGIGELIASVIDANRLQGIAARQGLGQALAGQIAARAPDRQGGIAVAIKEMYLGDAIPAIALPGPAGLIVFRELLPDHLGPAAVASLAGNFPKGVVADFLGTAGPHIGALDLPVQPVILVKRYIIPTATVGLDPVAQGFLGHVAVGIHLVISLITAGIRHVDKETAGVIAVIRGSIVRNGCVVRPPLELL